VGTWRLDAPNDGFALMHFRRASFYLLSWKYLQLLSFRNYLLEI